MPIATAALDGCWVHCCRWIQPHLSVCALLYLPVGLPKSPNLSEFLPFNLPLGFQQSTNLEVPTPLRLGRLEMSMMSGCSLFLLLIPWPGGMRWLKEMFILPGGIGRRLRRVRWSTVAEGALGGPILPKVLSWVGVLLGYG